MPSTVPRSCLIARALVRSKSICCKRWRREPTHGWARGEMKKQENRVDGLGHTSLLTKSFQQELLKTLFPFRSDAINGALAAARDFLATS